MLPSQREQFRSELTNALGEVRKVLAQHNLEKDFRLMVGKKAYSAIKSLNDANWDHVADEVHFGFTKIRSDYGYR